MFSAFGVSSQQKIVKKSLKENKEFLKVWECKIPNTFVVEQMKEEAKKIAPYVNISGFRKGNAPIDVIEKNYKDRCFSNAVNTKVNAVIEEILKTENYKIGLRPEVFFANEPSIESEIQFTVKFILKPNVPEIKYSKLSFDVVELEPSEEDIAKEMEFFRRAISKNNKINIDDSDYELKMGDIPVISFVGYADDVAFAGGEANDFEIEIGSRRLIDTFEEQLIGHKIGDKFDINVRFPENYHVKDLANKEAVFKVTVEKINIIKLLDLDDTLAKQFGFESVEKLKELLINNMKNSYISAIKNNLRPKIFDTIEKELDFKIPEIIIEREIDIRLERIKKSIEEKNNMESNVDIKEYQSFNETEERKKLLPKATHDYKMYYIFESIFENEHLQITEEDKKDYAVQYAMQTNQDPKNIVDRLSADADFNQKILEFVREDKIFNAVFSKINKKITKMDRTNCDKFLQDMSKKKI